MLEYSELFLFLLVAMTYIEAMRERNVFEALKVWLRNFAEMIFGWSSSKIVSGISEHRPRWPPQPNLL
jgi:Na+/H+ antiporter NhaD/arsenite permease-like protein